MLSATSTAPLGRGLVLGAIEITFYVNRGNIIKVDTKK